jgi:hypothetical protein
MYLSNQAVKINLEPARIGEKRRKGGSRGDKGSNSEPEADCEKVKAASENVEVDSKKKV